MKRGVYWGSVFLLLAAILGLVEAQFHLFRGLFGPASLEHREIATQFLGEYLAAHYSGKKAVVLSNPFSTQPKQPREVYQYEKAGLRGLRRGLAKAVTIEEVAYPEIRPEFFRDRRSVPIDPGTSTPLSYIVAEDALDKIARQHPQAEILISLIGLPVNVLQTETWRMGRKFALLLPDLRMLGNQSSIRQTGIRLYLELQGKLPAGGYRSSPRHLIPDRIIGIASAAAPQTARHIGSAQRDGIRKLKGCRQQIARRNAQRIG